MYKRQEEDQAFRWPEISAGLYYIPLGEGKRVVSDQEEWKLFLDGQELAVNEALSMPVSYTHLDVYKRQACARGSFPA